MENFLHILYLHLALRFGSALRNISWHISQMRSTTACKTSFWKIGQFPADISHGFSRIVRLRLATLYGLALPICKMTTSRTASSIDDKLAIAADHRRPTSSSASEMEYFFLFFHTLF
ncbi:hypothetical protein T4D_2819 [Trichinella pseudospiralis]|uniref:Secreted protein n=1 Tax=Trichinella pseudospiralis TaxID=6337 RepID=A0A0V1FQD0_TRIPS|nr:hypothetical protein T4D_2819 [Trichinella pseudospiralis]